MNYQYQTFLGKWEIVVSLNEKLMLETLITQKMCIPMYSAIHKDQGPLSSCHEYSSSLDRYRYNEEGYSS